MVQSCRRPVMKLLMATVGCLAASLAYADTGAVIPCDPMTVGSIWKYKLDGPMGPAEIKRVVVSNTDNVIRTEETTTLTVRGAQTKQEILSTMVNQGGKVALTEYTVHPLPSVKTSIAVCGHSGPGIKKIGTEKLAVPAGRFDAQVFEIVQDGPSAGDGNPTRQWSTIYYVPGIGTVKSIMVVETPTPRIERGTLSEAETSAILQEGIAAMQKGKDPGSVLDRLTKGGKSLPTVSAIEIKKNMIVRELISYAIE